MPTEVHQFWRTATACCELVYSHAHSARVLLWIGSRLVVRAGSHVINTEASALAAELRTAYA